MAVDDKEHEPIAPAATEGDDETREPAPEGDQRPDDLEAMKRALKKANKEAEKARLKMREIEEAETARKEAELSEIERAQKSAEKARAERDAAHDHLKQWRVRHAVEIAARDAKFHDPADAYLLADLSEIEVDDEGLVTGVTEVVAALAESKPHLIQQTSAPTGRVTNTPPASNGATVTSEELAARRRAFERSVKGW